MVSTDHLAPSLSRASEAVSVPRAMTSECPTATGCTVSIYTCSDLATYVSSPTVNHNFHITRSTWLDNTTHPVPVNRSPQPRSLKLRNLLVVRRNVSKMKLTHRRLLACVSTPLFLLHHLANCGCTAPRSAKLKAQQKSGKFSRSLSGDSSDVSYNSLDQQRCYAKKTSPHSNPTEGQSFSEAAQAFQTSRWVAQVVSFFVL